MNFHDLRKFYDDMLADIEMDQHHQFEYKKKSCNFEQRRFKKIREDAEKVIEWDHMP